jgi:hypothetical protein
VNIQDEIVFTSHMLNRDTWSDDVVQNLVASGFVFWQVLWPPPLACGNGLAVAHGRVLLSAQNYWASEHGKKFCSLYQIDRASLPVVVIIDPRTGEIRQRWAGFLEPQDMTEKRTCVALRVAGESRLRLLTLWLVPVLLAWLRRRQCRTSAA